MKGLKFLRENNARQRYLSLDECERLIQACVSSRVRAIVVIALHTGMRLGGNSQSPSSRFGLRFWPDSDSRFEERRAASYSDGFDHRFPAGDYPRHPSSDLMFANKAGGRFLEIRGGFKNACERAGISDLHFHDLRHTFASHWMMAGGDLYVLEEHSGAQVHRDDTTLRSPRARSSSEQLLIGWITFGRSVPSPHWCHGGSVERSSVTVRSPAQSPVLPHHRKLATDAGPSAYT